MSSSPLLPRELQITAVVSLVLLLGWVVYLLRHRSLSLRDSLLWLLSTLTALTFVGVPEVLFWVARVFGIHLPSNALFAMVFVYVLVNLLSVTIATSVGAVRVRRLAQECALLRAEIDLLRSELQQQRPGAGVASSARDVGAESSV